ncbi:kinase-like protein [Hyaloscypha variabilis F]|uniref:Kinase-like protein n=1 Tax=Hyaloscypha variabilis (strain UAMH 11265 / GT02V1 / F) TaxID=1149755 RepID=A0A2J6REB9_HYAVF|nr:kinase-like protein [Hyaloscypha variabilis F]
MMKSTAKWYYPWLEDEIICEVMGRVVAKSTTPTGEVVAMKVCHRNILLQSEADMLQHVTQHTSVKAPKLHRVYEVDSARVMETDFVPGVPLDTVWGSFGAETKAAIASQLREQVLAMRTSTQSFIGRVDFQPTFDIYLPLQNKSCGAFLTECEFDAHKVQLLEADSRKDKADLLSGMLSKLRTNPTTFVLTHGDLNPWNIHVQDTGSGWQICGILDWERSGFLPEYAEYTIAMTNPSHDEEWRKVLTEQVLVSCSKERVEAERLATRTFL